MLAQHVDAELLARLREAQQAIRGQDVGEDTTALVVMRHLEELKRCFFRTRLDVAVLGRVAEIVDACVLVVQRFIQHAASQAFGGEHALDEGLELYEAVVELGWHRAL